MFRISSGNRQGSSGPVHSSRRIVLALSCLIILFLTAVIAYAEDRQVVEDSREPVIALSFDEPVYVTKAVLLDEQQNLEIELESPNIGKQQQAFLFKPKSTLQDGFYTATVEAIGTITKEKTTISKRIEVKLKPVAVTFESPKYGGSTSRTFDLRIRLSRPAVECRYEGGNYLDVAPFEEMIYVFQKDDDAGLIFKIPISIDGNPVGLQDGVKKVIYVKCKDIYGDVTVKNQFNIPFEFANELTLEYDTTPPQVTADLLSNPVVEDRTTQATAYSDDDVYCKYTFADQGSESATDYFEGMEYEFKEVTSSWWKQLSSLLSTPSEFQKRYAYINYFSPNPNQTIVFPKEGNYRMNIMCTNRAGLMTPVFPFDVIVDSKLQADIMQIQPQAYVTTTRVDIVFATTKAALCYINSNAIDQEPPILGDGLPDPKYNVPPVNANNQKRFKTTVTVGAPGRYQVPVICKIIQDGVMKKGYITFIYDNTPPIMLNLSADDPDLGWPGYTRYLDRIHGRWKAEDNESDIALYNASVFDCTDQKQITPWMTTSDRNEWFDEGLDGEDLMLENNSRYGVQATAKNNAGIWQAAIKKSECVTVDTSKKPKENIPPRVVFNYTSSSTGITGKILCGDNVGGSGCDPSTYTYGTAEDGDRFGCDATKTEYISQTELLFSTEELPLYICYRAYDYSGNYGENVTYLSLGKVEEPKATECSDGIDNDHDGLIDLSDPGCADSSDNSESDHPDPLPQCSDGIDNDDDGMTDLQDRACAKASDNDESADPAVPPACSDGVDNDYDGKTDLQDPGCVAAGDNDEKDYLTPQQTTQCSDGKDNDNDKLVDLRDPGCYGAFDNNEADHPIEPRQCSDGIDNDGDKEIDLHDPGCFAASDNSEGPDPELVAACYDGIDDDYDGKVDLADPGCFAASDNDESDDPTVLTECSDGKDDDGDGQIDLFDLGCDAAADMTESPDGPRTECSNKVDDDNDGYTDYPDDKGCWGTSDDTEASDKIAFNDDMDKDGMSDAWERKVGLDPTRNDAKEDPDKDGLTNLQEYADVKTKWGDSSNPMKADTDADGWIDGVEMKRGTNPLDAKSHPTATWVYILIITGILAVLGGGSYYGWQYYENSRTPKFTPQPSRTMSPSPSRLQPSSLRKKEIDIDSLRDRQEAIKDLIEKKRQQKHDERDKMFRGFGDEGQLKEEAHEERKGIGDIINKKGSPKNLVDNALWGRLNKFISYSKGEIDVKKDEVFSKESLDKDKKTDAKTDEKTGGNQDTKAGKSAVDKLGHMNETSILDELKKKVGDRATIDDLRKTLSEEHVSEKKKDATSSSMDRLRKMDEDYSPKKKKS